MDEDDGDDEHDHADGHGVDDSDDVYEDSKDDYDADIHVADDVAAADGDSHDDDDEYYYYVLILLLLLVLPYYYYY